ncbi:hypothetical protein HY212_04610 [Candidatus Pacearchaeota archaeon]|nr:hypothetical protein [Candidatus Pacearchaeota archaeon]
MSAAALFLADLNLDSTNISGIDSVYLFDKRHNDPDINSNWSLLGNGIYNTSHPGFGPHWRIFANLTGLQREKFYDFRVIARLKNGYISYDLNGDGKFDDGTFHEGDCDCKTFLIK